MSGTDKLLFLSCSEIWQMADGGAHISIAKQSSHDVPWRVQIENHNLRRGDTSYSMPGSLQAQMPLQMSGHASAHTLISVSRG